MRSPARSGIWRAYADLACSVARRRQVAAWQPVGETAEGETVERYPIGGAAVWADRIRQTESGQDWHKERVVHGGYAKIERCRCSKTDAAMQRDGCSETERR